MTEVEIHGGAKYTNREMIEHIKAITKKVYGIEPDLAGVDFSSYYRPDGAKITKSLTTILRKTLDKQKVQGPFAEYGRQISELYTVSRTLVAHFGDKKLLGEGEYESGKTCIRDGGENQSSKDFLVKFRWARVLVLQDKKDPKAKARCICYLGGGRNVYLTNFYWNGISQNYLYFVSAIRKMFRLKKVLYRRNPKFFLPVYRNGDAIHIYDERSKIPYLGKKMPCPSCGDLVPEYQVHYEEYGSHRLIGCSPMCAKKASKIYKPCCDCGEWIYYQDMVQIDAKPGRDGKMICKICYRKKSVECGWCGSPHHKSAMVMIKGTLVCPNCSRNLPTCTSCQERFLREEVLSVSGSFMCKGCIKKKGLYCEVCRTIGTEKCKVIKVNGRSLHVCKDCLEPAPGTDLGMAAEK